jgi:hypothetical protein
MTFEISKGFPPNRESPIVELAVHHDGGVDIPAEIFWEGGQLRIALFGRRDGTPLEYSLVEWKDAIERAIGVLGDST